MSESTRSSSQALCEHGHMVDITTRNGDVTAQCPVDPSHRLSPDGERFLEQMRKANRRRRDPEPPTDDALR